MVIQCPYFRWVWVCGDSLWLAAQKAPRLGILLTRGSRCSCRDVHLPLLPHDMVKKQILGAFSDKKTPKLENRNEVFPLQICEGQALTSVTTYATRDVTNTHTFLSRSFSLT